MTKAIRTEFMQFLVVGGFAALVNFVSRIIINEWVGYRLAVILAYLVGMLTAFILSKIYVFEKSGRHHWHELRDFTLVNLLAVVQVWLISVGLAEYLFPAVGYTFYAPEVAHLIGLAIPAVTSYLGHKYYSFRKSP
ncbi:GtrA family protein [Thiohalophilus sp.]|uniref:GtrA family protein n=1 Tax=Thiohalophilus sp. TaxID=3028392 RepID=UPI002ACD6C40|nr:GtrA family protein [Thiohalophilus sp.]MDZ7661897.1 GtrA family protein [Thiohalophilus sp.]MDZ7803764.1 GtrA family protein [Thiohalophilus sp.]